MKNYEIFQKLPSQQVVCVEGLPTLESAKERLNELRQMFSGDYFIFDRQNACFVIPSDHVVHLKERELVAEVKQRLQIVSGHLQLISNSASIPLSRCSRDFRYLWVNQDYAAWLGRPLEKIVGRSIWDVLGRDCFRALQGRYEQVLSGSETRAYEENLPVSGLGLRKISAAYIPTLDVKGAPTGWIASVKDITSIRC